MPAPERNQNSVKLEEDKATSFLHMRAVPRDKAAWTKAAAKAGESLAGWATEVLNEAARKAGIKVDVEKS